MNNVNLNTTDPGQIIEHLVALRKQLGYTQAQLAFKLGVSPQQISKLESGSQDIQLTTLSNWANALGVLPALAKLPEWDGSRSVILGRSLAGNTLGVNLADMVGGVAVKGATGSGSASFAYVLMTRLAQCDIPTVVLDPGTTPAPGELLEADLLNIKTGTATWSAPGSQVQWYSCGDADAAVAALEVLITQAAQDRAFHGTARSMPLRAVLLDATRTPFGSKLSTSRVVEAMKKATKAGVIVLVSYKHGDEFDSDASELLHETAVQLVMAQTTGDPANAELAELFSSAEDQLRVEDFEKLDVGRGFLRRAQPDGIATVERIYAAVRVAG